MTRGRSIDVPQARRQPASIFLPSPQVLHSLVPKSELPTKQADLPEAEAMIAAGAAVFCPGLSCQGPFRGKSFLLTLVPVHSSGG